MHTGGRVKEGFNPTSCLQSQLPHGQRSQWAMQASCPPSQQCVRVVNNYADMRTLQNRFWGNKCGVENLMTLSL